MSDAPKRVLIVDDDPEITDVLSDYFKGKTGFTIETAATAEAGGRRPAGSAGPRALGP